MGALVAKRPLNKYPSNINEFVELGNDRLQRWLDLQNRMEPLMRDRPLEPEEVVPGSEHGPNATITNLLWTSDNAIRANWDVGVQNSMCSGFANCYKPFFKHDTDAPKQ